jgi:ABC-type branched-subunit amino acid transport system substrate-binding protein
MSPSRSLMSRRRRPAVTFGLAAAVLAASALAACGRSAGSTPTGQPASSGPGTAPASTTAAGDFGTLKAVCGPGDAKGATARGVTDTEIHIGVTADPGTASAPGLEQEFFDTADGFSKWCNAAGGILGRKIVVDKLDAKLFNVGQVMTKGCLQDFFLVGNGNAFDSAGVKIRENCKLGQIPAYVVSPQAVAGKYQVQPAPVPANEINDGAMRLLADAFPDSKTGGIAIASSTLASIIPTGLKAQEYLTQLGIKVALVQNQPVQIDNFRPYIEQLKNAGAKGLYQITSQDPNPVVQAMRNVGYNLDWILFSTQFYGPQAVQGAKSLGTFPPSYVQFFGLPFELADKYPVLQQTESIVKSAVSNPKLTAFTLSSFSAWLLFADSAKSCGSALTMDCVLQKAGSYADWTAGGLYPKQDLRPGHQHASPCIALVRLTANGFVYDDKATAPTTGDYPYNCDPDNVKTVKTYVSG